MFRKFLLLMCLFALIVVTVRAQDETSLFTVVSTDPIVAHGTSWDSQFTDPGAVVYHDGQFHMFRNGFKGWPASVEIGYVTSDDGLTWTKVGDEPVMMTKDVPYAKVAALASSALVEEDGTWVLYFYIWDQNSWPKSSGSIGRATAPAPSGPWTPDAAPVLLPGAAGAWDDLQVTAPSVVKTEDGYVMYYAGVNQKSVNGIGMATSTDGLNWSKYNDPATTDAPFAESDPLLMATGNRSDFDFQGVYQPNVQQTPDGWVMLYKGIGNNPRSLPHGYATSEDGVTWTRYADNPVLTVKAIPGGNGLWFTNLLYHDDTYYLFFEVGKGQDTNIYLATHEGGLRGE